MIVTFYSYKGGVGRSMALANVAQYCRQLGLRVVVVDWDLEAPGLETFLFQDEKRRRAVSERLGVIDLVSTFRDMFPTLANGAWQGVAEGSPSGIATSVGRARQQDHLAEVLPPIRPFLIPVPTLTTGDGTEGSLHFLPAGSRADARFKSYSETVQDFDWGLLYSEGGGEAYFEWLRAQLDDPKTTDIVFIDSRTGVSEMNGPCTRQLSDVVVLLCAPNVQNLEGTALMATSFTRPEVMAARKGRPNHLVHVPARIDISEGAKGDRFLTEFNEKLSGHLPEPLLRLRRKFSGLRIPYISDYAFSERLAIGDPDGAKDLQESYVALAAHIAALAPRDSQVRLRFLADLQVVFGPDVLASLDDSYLAVTSEQQMRVEQLKKALAAGLIDEKTFDTAVAAIAQALNAKAGRDGAIAQGTDAVAVGKGGVLISGTLNTGAAINTGGGAYVGGGAMTAASAGVMQASVQVTGGHFIGRDFIQILTAAVGVETDVDEAKSIVAGYLSSLVSDLAGLKIGEIDSSVDQTRQSPLQLDDIYVPLDTTHRIPKNAMLKAWLASESNTLARQTARTSAEPEERETRPVSALEALAAHRELTLIGAPGSGKTTYGSSVLLALAQACQGDTDRLKVLGDEWSHGALLPIRIVLRHLADSLPPGDAPARAGDVWSFVRESLERGGYITARDNAQYLERIATSHGALFLFDGLDECGNDHQRSRVEVGVREFIRTAHKSSCFILTARPYAFPSGTDASNGVYALAQFNDKQIEAFIRAWYSALVRRNWRLPAGLERKIDDLLRARQQPDLAPLARNPLLLTLMATLHTNRGSLPNDRADLYNDAVELLLLRWNRPNNHEKALKEQLNVPSLKLADFREALEELAFQIHGEDVADIPEHVLLKALDGLLGGSTDKARVMVDFIEKRAGLLIGQGSRNGEPQFAFPHRTFQEYLAACHLASLDDFPSRCAVLGRQEPGRWQVVLTLAARVAKLERGASAADELVGGRSIEERRRDGAVTPADWTCATLAGLQLQELGNGAINARERTRAIAWRVTGWLTAALPVHPDDGGLPAAERARAGDLLAALGDPRFDPARFYLPADEALGFVRIPADDDFRIGVRRRDQQRLSKLLGSDIGSDEVNDDVTPSAEFYVARYPVTVAQFRAFVEAERFKLGDGDALRDLDTRPVGRVSWHEARAYCSWLTSMLASSTALAATPIAKLVRDDGWQVTLPSELEWEKATRGGRNGMLFPWGDKADANRANGATSGINTTSVVGCFPANGFGLHDCIGNVWEWTRSRPAPYPYVPDDGRELLDGDNARVVRGGSWLLSPSVARCSSRRKDPPDFRYYSIGFRVVLRSSPVR